MTPQDMTFQELQELVEYDAFANLQIPNREWRRARGLSTAMSSRAFYAYSRGIITEREGDQLFWLQRLMNRWVRITLDKLPPLTGTTNP